MCEFFFVLRGGCEFEHKMCVLIFSTNFAWKIFNSEKWARYDDKFISVFMYVKYPRSLFNGSWICPTDFPTKKKSLNYQISWKSVQWESSCSVRTHGRTDMTKRRFAFRNLGKLALENHTFLPHSVLRRLYGSKNKQRIFPYTALTQLFS
jgi:hypothetical protein